MKCIITIVVAVGLTLIGAISHEADLARNFKEDGDACAWIWEIKDSTHIEEAK